MSFGSLRPSFRGGNVCFPRYRTILILFISIYLLLRHWELHEPEVKERSEPNTFDVRMSATYDWEGCSTSAIARGIVHCLPSKKEVRVEDYTYKVSGTPR